MVGGNNEMKKKYVITIIFTISLIICSISAYGLNQTQTVKVNAIENNKETVTNLRAGDFNAELGIRGNERPIIELHGTYHYKGRLIFVKGDEDHRFSGMLRGNVFFIRIQVRDRGLTIYGRCRYGEDNSFAGVWISRGLQNRGWIEGLFD